MKGLFRFEKTLAVLAGAGVAVVIAGVAAFANGGSVSVTPCDPTVATCVTVFQPVIRNFEKATGPSFTDITGGTPHPVITMNAVPNGFYKVEANGILDIPASDVLTDFETGTPTNFDWTCQLVMVTADNGTGAIVDAWEEEATFLTDATFFLKAAVNLNSSNGEGSFRVDCANNDLGVWSSASLKIIAVDASDLISQPGS